MDIYKYRGGHFERDLDSLVNNCFYASSAECLNDPCEMLVFSEKVKLQVGLFGKLFGKQSGSKIFELNSGIDELLKRRNELGIYSLSKTYKDELLWAHYADGHKGFCIEYNLDILLNKNSFSKLRSFPVKYETKPPQIDLNDLMGDNLNFYKKIAGVKSKKWLYEEEIRIISDEVGKQDYDYEALKSIYFGYKMDDEEKQIIMERLQGRGISYYQIQLDDKSYSFYREKVTDSFEISKKYLFEFDQERESQNNQRIKYKILTREYLGHFKGRLTIELENKMSENELVVFGAELKRKLFFKAERLYVFYSLFGCVSDSAWAYTHFEGDKISVQILGLKIEDEFAFCKVIQNDTRNIIGHWIDSSPFSGLLTLFSVDNKVYLENLYADQSKSIKEQNVVRVPDGIRYQDAKENKHGEYLIVDHDEFLNYYSKEGLFRKIPRFHI